MKASDTSIDAPVTPDVVDPVAAAIGAINQAAAEVEVTTGGGPGGDLKPTVLERHGVERRVLGFITDEVDNTALGPRNTLAALTYALSHDRATTNPGGGNPRLEVDGKTLAEVAQTILDMLNGLIELGLVAQRDDGSYELTEAGEAELRT